MNKPAPPADGMNFLQMIRLYVCARAVTQEVGTGGSLQTRTTFAIIGRSRKMTIEEAINQLNTLFVPFPECLWDHQTYDTNKALKMAIDALREKQKAENIGPLTLEELLQMEGQPVWVVPADPKDPCRWCIVSGTSALIAGCDYPWYSEYDYRTDLKDGKGKEGKGGWVAYRRPPEIGK